MPPRPPPPLTYTPRAPFLASSWQIPRWWGTGAEKSWWSSDPEISESARSGDASSHSSASSTNNGTLLTPWYVATDAAGNIYVTASEEEAEGNVRGGFVDRDVFKYDGTSGDAIGRFSTCFGGTVLVL